LFLIGQPQSTVPLGSFFENSLDHSHLVKFKDKLDLIVNKKLGLSSQKGEYLQVVLNCMKGRVMYFSKCSYKKLSGQQNQEFFNNLISLYSEPSLSRDYIDLHFLLAKDLAAELGLHENHLWMSQDASVKNAEVWHCSLYGKPVKNCFNFREEFTSIGMGHTMNYVDWEKQFRASDLYANQFVNKGGHAELSAKSEVSLLINMHLSEG